MLWANLWKVVILCRVSRSDLFFEELPLLVAGERVGRGKSESSDNGLRPLMQFSKRQWAIGLGVVGDRRRQRDEWAAREGGVEDDSP